MMTLSSSELVTVATSGLVALLSGGAGAWLVGRKRELRFFKNAKRPVFLFEFGEKLSSAKAALQDTGFIPNVEGPFSSPADADRIGRAGLVVISFPSEPPQPDQETEEHKRQKELFFQVFEKAKQRDLPILVYAEGGGIKRCFARLAYSRAAVCNFQLRLISDVFAVLSTYPEQKQP